MRVEKVVREEKIITITTLTDRRFFVYEVKANRA